MQGRDSEAADELEMDATRQDVILIPPGLQDKQRGFLRQEDLKGTSPVARWRLCLHVQL